MIPLSDRNIRALAWLVDENRPRVWYDICDAAGGYRPSKIAIVDPLADRGLIEIREPAARLWPGDHYSATKAGIAMIVQLRHHRVIE